ncbi:hypothetical protein Clacol_006099 [Clathrus columnatus]|uniref:tripeptidyl-peptidase II n=1 Tax=Clathrus columnatus TaxID=1419009 RepID=A0AAV5AFW7_9AGAM|nr:hypothetical protein Clacol_006099 [Clathrus columnatus]
MSAETNCILLQKTEKRFEYEIAQFYLIGWPELFPDHVIGELCPAHGQTAFSLARLEQLVVHRQLDTIPDGYIQVGRANPEQTIKLSIGLASNNNTGLTKRLYEVDEHLRPNVNTTRAFNQWMSRHGIEPNATSSSGNHFSIELTVSKAEKLLNTTFHYFNHEASNESLIRTKEYSVPSSLQEDILLLQPTTHIPPEPHPRRRRDRPRASASNTTIRRRQLTCEQAFEVSCVQGQYGIPADVQTTDQVGILSFNNQAVQGVSLAKIIWPLKIYMSQFRDDISLGSVDVEIISIDGGNNQDPQQKDTNEANLDIQMVLGLVPTTKVKVIATGSTHSDPLLDDLDTFNYLLSRSDPPPVLTMSYGIDESGISLDSAKAVCEAIKALGARGVTVITASGDGGVAGGGQSNSCTTFQITFPSSCPWTLSVGATNITTGTEIGADFSTGGFSRIFAMEDFQVNTFINFQQQMGNTYAGLYNGGGSMAPVLSMVGAGLLVRDQNIFTLEDGTSASAPITAAAITGLNQIRTSRGESRLGFASPFMYMNPDVFNDITQAQAQILDAILMAFRPYQLGTR